MDKPKFFLVLGPSGAGKSSIFDGRLGVDALNRDKLLQRLSGHNDLARAGREAKLLARHEESEFIREHLEQGKSFATERTFTYATELKRLDEAKAKGFEVHTIFIAAGDADTHVQRAEARVAAKGHQVKEAEVRDIHEQSMRNFPLLFAAAAEGKTDTLTVYENSDKPKQILALQQGAGTSLNIRPPAWFREALENTSFHTGALRQITRTGESVATLDVNGPNRRRALAAELDPVDVVTANRFAQGLNQRAVMDDMQTVRERLLQGRSAQEIKNEITQDHGKAPGASGYAKELLAVVAEQTGWSPAPSSKESQSARTEYAVRVTPSQAETLLRRTATNGQPPMQVTDLQQGNESRDVLNGRAQLGYSSTSHAFYAVLLEGSEADLRNDIAAAAPPEPLLSPSDQAKSDSPAAQQRGGLRFWQETENGLTVKHAAGPLTTPGTNAFPRDIQAQRAVSRGTGYDAGHLIGHQFGGPEIPGNLSLQNHLMNQGGGTFYNVEQRWAASLAQGDTVDVHVTEYTRATDSAFLYRRVESVTTNPQGEIARETSLFVNPESERVRRAEGRDNQPLATAGVVVPLPQQPEPEPQDIGVLLTDNQAKLLLQDKHKNDRASYQREFLDALSGESPVTILDGRAELDFDSERERFYVALKETDKPALDQRLTVLQTADAERIKRDASRHRDSEHERE